MGDKFCAAPFTSLYEGQFGKVTACCAMYTELGSTHQADLESIVNNEKFKNIRKSFLNNTFPKECDTCSNFEKETGSIADVRDASNKFGRSKIKEAIIATDSTGYMQQQFPVMLDFLWTNKCNFACLGCNGELSSTIAQNYNEAFALAHGCNSDSLNSKLWRNNNDNKIDYILKHQDSIEKIHLNGGEPFMQEDVHELLEIMIKHNLHKKITIWSHTNGSISKYKSINIIDDYLARWGKKCIITISHDGHGKQGEYVRYGLKQQKWLETLNNLQNANVNVNIQTCYSVFNALHLAELYQWYDDNTKVDRRDRKINPWYDPLPYTAKFLQVDEELFAQANQQLDILNNIIQGNNSWNIAHLKSFLNTREADNKLHVAKTRFASSLQKFDALRNTDFTSTFPELREFYLNCSENGSKSEPHF